MPRASASSASSAPQQTLGFQAWLLRARSAVRTPLRTTRALAWAEVRETGRRPDSGSLAQRRCGRSFTRIYFRDLKYHEALAEPQGERTAYAPQNQRPWAPSNSGTGGRRKVLTTISQGGRNVEAEREMGGHKCRHKGIKLNRASESLRAQPAPRIGSATLAA
jgi:hypothetical protein